MGVKNMSGRWSFGVSDGDQESTAKALLWFQGNQRVWREANGWPNFPLAFVYSKSKAERATGSSAANLSPK